MRRTVYAVNAIGLKYQRNFQVSIRSDTFQNFLQALDVNQRCYLKRLRADHSLVAKNTPNRPYITSLLLTFFKQQAMLSLVQFSLLSTFLVSNKNYAMICSCQVLFPWMLAFCKCGPLQLVVVLDSEPHTEKEMSTFLQRNDSSFCLYLQWLASLLSFA